MKLVRHAHQISCLLNFFLCSACNNHVVHVVALSTREFLFFSSSTASLRTWEFIERNWLDCFYVLGWKNIFCWRRRRPHNTTTTVSCEEKNLSPPPESLNSFYVIMRWCSHSGSQKKNIYFIPPRDLFKNFSFSCP